MALPGGLPLFGFPDKNPEKIAGHVVLCILGGGVRNNETIDKQLGNLLPNILGGSEEINPRIRPFVDTISTFSGKSILQSGTLFRKFSYAKGPVSHYDAITSILTGNYLDKKLSGSDKISFKTIFDFHSRYGSAPEKSCFVSNPVSPYPFVSNTFFRAVDCGNPELKASLLNDNGYQKKTPLIGSDPNFLNADIMTALVAEKIIVNDNPELLVLNFQAADICHSNFSAYCNSLIKADFAIGKLWNSIQNTPGMANDTVLIVLPDHGRNHSGNSLLDSAGFEGFDHHEDSGSREIFCLIAGPEGRVRQNKIIDQIAGETIDILPTISGILGFQQQIPINLMSGRMLGEAFENTMTVVNNPVV